MKYSIDKSKLPPEDIRWLSNLEHDFIDEVQMVVNMSAELDWELAHIVSVVERKKGEPFINLETNAGWKIPGSLHVNLTLKEWFEKRIDYEPANVALSVKLTFRAKTADEQKTKSASDDGLSTFIPETPRHTFDQIIIPDETRKQIMDSLSVVVHRELVYNTWGFGKCDKSPNSILSFYGPPGTGKTMCAHAIAAYLNKPLLAFNYADIESKYVGEAAKNLKKAFETATKLDAVMFFDEADSFLGKRIGDVQHGSDQSLNSQRSQMLIYLEEFKGVVIFATNLQSNVDKAFESRILAHIKIDLPNREARAAIIRTLIPAQLPLVAPLTDDDLLRASDTIEGLAGREIKQAIKTLLFRKAAELGADAKFSADDIVNAMASKKKEVDALANEEQERIKAEKEKKKKKVLEALMRNAEEKVEYLDKMTIEDLQAAIDRRPEVEARRKAEEEAMQNE